MTVGLHVLYTLVVCIAVVVYKCAAMAANCGSCLTQDDRYNCGWCPATGTCSITDHCDSSGAAKTWFSDGICPDPRITKVHRRDVV